jgi:hypothetical protein
MAIWQVLGTEIRQVQETAFDAEGLRERQDLQRLLRDNIQVISPDTLVIAEEYGDWTEGRRRIDLLGLDRSANVVVIELKRNETGGHMELQAIRYAALVSTLTFKNAVEIYRQYLRASGRDEDPESALLDFLQWDEPQEDNFAEDVRIVLASAEFSKELTTSVMWLNDKGIDIRCVRLKPYRLYEQVLLDVQQIIPLPEASDYQVQVREKEVQKRIERVSNMDYTRYDLQVAGAEHIGQWKNWMIYEVVRAAVERGVSPAELAEVMPTGHRRFVTVDGTCSHEEFLAKLASVEKPGGGTFDPRRYFCADDELIHFQGRTYAFSNQWSKNTVFPALAAVAEKYPELKISWNKCAGNSAGGDEGSVV